MRKVVLLLLPLGLSACLGLDLEPTDRFTDNTYWTTREKAEMFLNRAYSQMFGSSEFFANEFLSDNVYEGGLTTNEMLIVTGQANSDNGRFASEWANCYAGIKTCHIFLANINRVTDITDSDRNRMIAEARFIRAYLYLRLTTWFGDVPFFTSDISLEEAKTIGRTSHTEVVAFIHQELEQIVPSLPTKEEYSEADRGRITCGAAIALNARAYLYDNDYEHVAEWCNKLIDNKDYGAYALFPKYAGLFSQANEYNEEIILDLEFVNPRYWTNLFDMAPRSCGARDNAAAPTQELVDSYIMMNGKSINDIDSEYDENNPYENRDPRMEATIVRHLSWIVPLGKTEQKLIYTKPGSTTNPDDMVDVYTGSGISSTVTGYYYRKFYESTLAAGFLSELNLPLIRYADILLMYAEAMYEIGKMDETVWNQTIRLLRERAGFTLASALDYPGKSADLRQIIRNERRSELALEGLRVFDIRRWKLSEKVLNGYPHGAKFGDLSVDDGYVRLNKRSFNPERDYLWAVPLSQRDINPNLGQNPKY